MKTVAKFKVSEVSSFESSRQVRTEDGQHLRWEPAIGQRVKFNIVTGERPQDEDFAMYSPSGQVEMVINNPALVDQFKPGQYYFFDIIPESEYKK